MSIEKLGVTPCPGCISSPDPHYHQHWIIWPDEVAEQTDLDPI